MGYIVENTKMEIETNLGDSDEDILQAVETVSSGLYESGIIGSKEGVERFNESALYSLNQGKPFFFDMQIAYNDSRKYGKENPNAKS